MGLIKKKFSQSTKLCIGCDKAFHEACLATVTYSDAAAWTCPLCTGKQWNNDNTPVRGEGVLRGEAKGAISY